MQLNWIKKSFSWASVWKSPIYCDNRLILISSSKKLCSDEFSKNIEKQFGKPDVIAGVATGAIGIGMLVAESMGTICICSSRPKHGRQNQVEGFTKGQNVVVVEDLISTGNSSTSRWSLRLAGANVKSMAAIFTYGFAVSEENFKMLILISFWATIKIY
jgi:orotate phosphoribosyltransferase